MTETSGTFSGWSDRLTYLLAEGQLLAAGLAVSVGILFVWFKPSLPGIPPIVGGIFAALLLLGPPLVGLFVTGARALRNRNMITVYHINGQTDTRRKFYVEPGVWSEKTVDGPSPYLCNDGDAFEVREFNWFEDTENLTVRGCYMSQMADSKLVTTKAMLDDVHGDLVEAYLELNRLRGRISKMGLQIQSDVINEEAEADERGLMNPKTAVKERFEDAKDDAEDNAVEEIEDIGGYVEDYAEEHDAPHGPPATLSSEQAATDGGTDQ
ncbi:hypothetical protein SAMN06269185_1178 [Natronoarchaeum philippinense]|uniref:Uncharacterized protein n=1 Tax=Natronoarchaeum philippinense TaxID=558529 RepID=A0A285NAJ6_NATPI|nr:hypothetical protein [Natronoarchaeum philippinense]SNZ06460.1 hypothetical protein SAMN06269185_1178 [Natronoarchaeum philippinense]